MLNDNDNDVLSLIREVQVAKPSELVVEQLLKLITGGMLKPGEFLPPERELTKRFGISRNYVREGIKTLELYGVLKPMQGKGTVVTDSGIRGLQGIIKVVLKLTRSDLLALADTRLLIETETARLAARNRTAQDKKELSACLDELREHAQNGGGLMSDIRLHIMIADISRNTVMASLVRLITPDIVAYYRDLRNDNSSGSLAIHEKVVDSILAGDEEAAARHMRDHLADSRRNFTKALERRRSVRTKSKTT